MKKKTYKELYRHYLMSKRKMTFTEWLGKFYPERLAPNQQL